MNSGAPMKLLSSITGNFTNCAIWIDLPRGSRWRAGKLATLQSILKDIVKCPDLQIVCVTPFLRGGLGYTLPHQRWKQLLSVWKPLTTTVCSCGSGLDNDYHHNYRIFSTLKLPECHLCGRRDTGVPDMLQYRYFLRK